MSRILLADDNEDILELTSSFLKSMTGVDPELCPDGEKAIDLLRSSVANKFCVVLTDFEMGEGPDGIDVANEAVRQQISNVFVSTCYSSVNNNSKKSERLRNAGKLPGVKIVGKMDIDDLERYIIPILKEAV